MALTLAEDSWYDHSEYGRVRLVSIDRETNTVLLEKGEATYVSGVGDLPAGTRESIDAFTQNAAPADISVAPPAVEMDAESPDIR